MKYLLPLLVALLFLSFQNPSKSFPPTKEVYICDSKGSKAYHFKKDCKGIKKCKAKIKKITLKKATNYGRTKCKLEK